MLVSFAASVALLGVLVFVPTVVFVWLTRLRPRLMRRHIKPVLREARIGHYESIGLRPSKRRLKTQLNRESVTLLAQDCVAALSGNSAKLPRWYPLDRSLVDEGQLLETLFLDLKDSKRGHPELESLKKALASLDLPLRQQTWWWSRSIAFSFAIILTGVLGPSAIDLLSAIQDSQPLWITNMSGPLVSIVLAGSVDWLGLVGITITAVLATIVSQLLLSRTYETFDHKYPAIRNDCAEITQDPAPKDKPIGRDNEAIRTLNFSGGAFDTYMQLGVTHALLTIQGRAPDVVVGLSSGALHAVALAEVLQKGEEFERAALKEFRASGEKDEESFWNDEEFKKDRLALHSQRLVARVKELRRFIEAEQRAPERLYDAIFPDAYQVDSGDPLHPLEQPRFSPKERIEKAEAVRRRSGLVRLYNDLLAIPFSIGTITRVIRRILGWKAASEIKRNSAKWLVRVSEAFRLWVLLGVNLWHAAPLIGVLVDMLFQRHKPKLANAGALIFKFPIVVGTLKSIKRGSLFIWLLAAWGGFSTAFLFPLLLITAFGQLDFAPAMIVSPLGWAVIAVVWSHFAQGGSEIDRMNYEIAIGDVTKAIVMFVGSTLLWGGLLVSLVAAILVLGDISDARSITTLSLLKKSWTSAAVISIVVLLITVIAIYYVWQVGVLSRFLQSYDLGDSLLKEHGLRSYFVELFDNNYYGKSKFDRIVEASLADEKRGTVTKEQHKPPKTVGYYKAEARLEPIHVGIAIANISTGKLELVSRDIPVVKGLLAAVSVTPLFPAVELGDGLYVDGSNVTQEPTRALLKALRGKLNSKSRIVHVYSVSAFPVSQHRLPAKVTKRPLDKSTDFKGTGGDILLNLVDVATSALKLQRFRDATLETRLTEVFSRVIPKERVQFEIEGKDDEHGNRKLESFFRAWVTPIELESDDSLARRILRAPKEKRRIAILEAIADGCRASLQVMIPDAIEQVTNGEPAKKPDRLIHDAELGHVVRCSLAVQQHMSTRAIADDLRKSTLPGSDRQIGPGLSEVCAHCRLWRNPPKATASSAAKRRQFREAIRLRRDQHLRFSDDHLEWGPSWPHERETEVVKGDRHFRRVESPEKDKTRRNLEKLHKSQENEGSHSKNDDRARKSWPRDTEHPGPTVPGGQRHTVSFLFSGGVFRGVYQMGVLNALNLLKLQPDVIAGASIGSITAAMVAKTFALEDEIQRNARIARLSAVYLAVDRLILTDRFADFVRDFTLRAADTHFSIRQADRVFRKYDAPRFDEFDRNTRQVLAGIERLLYISPYQINELVRASRTRDLQTVGLLLRDFAQQVLDRAQIGDEALGAEPLRDLIEEYVHDKNVRRPAGETIDDIRDQSQIQFLATATNLTEGRLEVLGERPVMDSHRNEDAPVLIEALLASSAFPGVFRPRWSWDLFPATNQQHQYIDGGVMDNLPIDAVAQFLNRAATQGIIVKTPPPVTISDENNQVILGQDGQPKTVSAPHLAIAISLEVNTPPFVLPSTRKELRSDWPSLSSRSKELRYNEKLLSYAGAETKLRHIANALQQQASSASSNVPEKGEFEALSLEIVPIKPQWLPNTFGFHPMLGFKRKKQALSIAHGCASTILTFARMEHDEEKADFLKVWNIHQRLNGLRAQHWGQAFRQWESKASKLEAKIADIKKREGPAEQLQQEKLALEKELGSCCWLLGITCPYSRQALEDTNDKLRKMSERDPKDDGSTLNKPIPARTIEELIKIHTACSKSNTHLREI